MDAESCYPFYVPPPFSSYPAPSSPDKTIIAYDEKLKTVSDLELHFNTLFMLESEKGRRNKELHPILEEDNENLCYWQENTAQYPSKTNGPESFTYSELSTCSYPNSDYHQSASSTDCSPVKNQPNWTDAVTSNYWNYEADVQNNPFNDSIYTGRLTPDSISEDIIETPYVEKCPLPPLETAFSKHFNRFAEIDASIPENGVTCNNLDLYPNPKQNLSINNLDNYYYPDNVNNDGCQRKEEYTDKNVEFAELFNCINLDEKNDMLDLGVKVFENDHVKSNDCDLITDLDSLNYFQDDEEDDMVGFEEYWSPSAESNTNKYERFFDEASKETHSNDECFCYWRDCNVDFKNQATLVDHIEKTHVNSFKGEEFSCFWESCPRKLRPFNARYKLVIHMRVHTGHKPNVCSYPGCGKAFSRLENLKIHSRSHTGERPYRCQAPRCTKAFSNSSDRAKHQRTHFNARPYACQVNGCAKRYTDPSSLRKHVKVHSNIAENIFDAIQMNETEKHNQPKCQKSIPNPCKKVVKENKNVKKPAPIVNADEEWKNRKRASNEYYMSDAKRRIKEKITGNIASSAKQIQTDSAANGQMTDWSFSYANINNESTNLHYEQRELNLNFYDE